MDFIADLVEFPSCCCLIPDSKPAPVTHPHPWWDWKTKNENSWIEIKTVYR